MNNTPTVFILGTCSGTEPMPNRHHTSFVVEYNRRLYWFDAGESCSYTAHLAGIDLPSTECIFISHTHMDHIGGLPNLLWTLRKLTTVSEKAKRKLLDRTLDIYIPNPQVFDGVLSMLRGTEGGFKTRFHIKAKTCEDGEIFARNGVRVKAHHNNHLGACLPFQSFSFRIEAGGKVIVYSGDVRSIWDVEPIIDGADLFLMETGHHTVEDVCQYLKTTPKTVRQLVFLHHGRAILNDPRHELEKARAILGNSVQIAHDGQRITL